MFGFWSLEFEIRNFDFVFFAWDLEFGILCLEFCILGVQIWDSVLKFCSLVFGVWNVEVWEFDFWGFGHGN